MTTRETRPQTERRHTMAQTKGRHFAAAGAGADSSCQVLAMPGMCTAGSGTVPNQAVQAELERPNVLDTHEELIAAVAHELRLPLSHIQGFVSSLRRTDVRWDEATRAEFLADIEMETERLAQLVDSLLTVRPPGGGGASSAALAFTEPADVVQGGLHRVRSLLGLRPLRLKVPRSLPSVRMDASQMERVLANLIQNAINYSPPDTAIGIAAWITDDGDLELAVEDEGPGIPLEDHERIFEPFYRKPSSEPTKIAGHGLGLAICRSIVLAHGGRIQVGDRPGGGARFSVVLPTPFTRRFQTKDGGDDPTEHSGLGRPGADRQARLEQPRGQRIRRARGRRRQPAVDVDPGAPVRPAGQAA